MWLSTFLPPACAIKLMWCLNQGHTLVRPLPNCWCHILMHSWILCNQCQHWSQPFAGSIPFDLHPMLKDNHHWAQINWCKCHPNEELASFNQSYSLLKVVFTWVVVLNMCGMRLSADIIISISILQKPSNLRRLNRDLMQVSGLSSCTTFMHVELALWGKYVTSKNTKNTFCKFQV